MRNKVGPWAILVSLAILVVGGLLYWPSGSGPRTADSAYWPGAGLKEVTRVEVRGPDHEYALQLVDGVWQVEAGNKTATGDSDRVAALIRSFRRTRPLTRFPSLSNTQIRRYGLDNPLYRITFHHKHSWALELGLPTAKGDGIYAGDDAAGGGYYLLDSVCGEWLTKGPSYYYDKRLVSFSATGMASVRIKGPGAGQGPLEWEVARNAKSDGYAFTAPEDLRDLPVDQWEMDFYLNGLAELAAQAFPEADSPSLPDPDQEAPFASIMIQGAGGEEQVDIFAHPGRPGEYLARSTRQPALGILDPGLVRRLTESPFYLRDRRVCRVDIWPVIRMILTVQGPEGREERFMRAAKTESGWVDEGDWRPIMGMDMLTWRLTDLKYDIEPVRKLPATASYRLSWELFARDEKAVAAFDFYLDPDLPEERCWMSVRGEEGYYRVEDALLEDLQGQVPARNQ